LTNCGRPEPVCASTWARKVSRSSCTPGRAWCPPAGAAGRRSVRPPRRAAGAADGGGQQSAGGVCGPRGERRSSDHGSQHISGAASPASSGTLPRASLGDWHAPAPRPGRAQPHHPARAHAAGGTRARAGTDLPPPVGISTSASPPPVTRSITSRWPWRSLRRLRLVSPSATAWPVSSRRRSSPFRRSPW
jgi:hypothetical protein